MGVNWTEEQQKVIGLRDRNILVAAAAGSGKTAVLVERIIAMLTQDADPIDVDRLLIVTFTKAAAAEMKERILAVIEKKLAEDPENLHLQRQATLIHSAQITTIDSFCLSVVKEHFHTIDLEPGFRTAEEGELKLLEKDVLEELLEEQYDKGEEKFLRFVETYATGKHDKKLESMILQVYRYAQSYPNPSAWLKSCIESYEIGSLEALLDATIGRRAEEHIRRLAEEAVAVLREALLICDEEDGPYMYKETLEEDLTGWEYFCSAKNLAEMFERLKSAEGGKLKANRDKAVSKELAKLVQDMRKQVKGIWGDIKAGYLFESPKEMAEDMRASKETVEELMFLAEEFGRMFSEKKRSKNLIDFGDMEHLALQILTEERDGRLIPSKVAEEYQKRFKEVMIDEYQDSNFIQEAILTSVSTVSRGKYNIFMVGDVKQSIYRFRLSRPELFMEKYDTYDLADSQKQRIDLYKNFRSRKEVLDSTNFVFRQIMTKGLGGIAYDEKAALYPGVDYKAHPGNETEILVVDLDAAADEREAEETAKELEARAVAGRIKGLIQNHEVLDKATGEFRPVQYKDIVILTRSLKGWTDVFAKVLNREGIPTYTGSREGYFETLEVETILNYLRVLDNPKQDIPLAAVLASDIGGLSGEELAEIRSISEDAAFHACVRMYSEEGTNPVLRMKIQKCFEQMAYFREMVPYTEIHELLWRILEETGYRYIAAAMPGGEQRNANVEMLLEKARVFESTSYKGLFNFVRYIEQLKKYDVDYGEANIADEQANTVKLMSIHKSKGLEFPIVFVAGMNKGFNEMDSRADLVIHSELGVGVERIDLEKRTKAPTLIQRVIKREIQLENLGEELRLLYVAMTRAKEKLILIGSMKEVEKKFAKYERLEEREEEQLDFSTISKAKSYFDWVLPCYLRYPESKTSTKVRCVNLSDLVREEVFEELDAGYTKEMLLNLETERVFSEEFGGWLKEQFDYIYPYENEKNLKLKFTVSELKKRQSLKEESGELLYEEEEPTPLLLQKLTEDTGLTGAGRGTAYHKVLELLDFTKVYNKVSLEKELLGFEKSGRLSFEMQRSIRVYDILKFLGTGAAKRMRQAAVTGRLFKEQPFVLGVDSSEVYDVAGELLLIQGIIDVWFEEEDGLVVLDYKTDRVKRSADLKEKYGSQLDYYAKALERMLGKPVKEKIIYSFSLQEEISL